jgi:hypothetical protein
MQESEFTGCANKVQGREQNREKSRSFGTARVPAFVGMQPSAETANKVGPLKPKTPPFAHALTLLPASCTMI